MDFAKRAYDHGFPFDPIIRHLGDLDFYKLLMHQFIWRNFYGTTATFGLKNRTKSVRLADDIDIDELRRQLDHVKTLEWEESFLIWLEGNKFYGQDGIFAPGYMDYLRHSFKLSDYRLEHEFSDEVLVEDDGFGHPIHETTGQIVLTFHGPWLETTLWETFAMCIVNELRYRKKLATMPKWRLDIMYAQAKVKLFKKLQRLATLPELSITDFGTRRRHSFLWQEFCVLMMKEVLGKRFTGTSNAYLAYRHGLDAKGTNAHELPMAVAALAQGDHDLAQAQYKVLKLWQDDYRGNLLVCLPDTFGTTQFLKNAPEFLTYWTGHRPDSKDPFVAGDEIIDWWLSKSIAPTDKLVLFSDGLDVKIDGFEPQGVDIVELYNYFHGRIRDGYGWGTMLTNDFIGCDPVDPDNMKPISIVCKVKDADGRPAVKLSDNFTKATGPTEEIERYRRVFGVEGVKDAPVVV